MREAVRRVLFPQGDLAAPEVDAQEAGEGQLSALAGSAFDRPAKGFMARARRGVAMAERNIPGNKTPTEQQEDVVSGKEGERKDLRKEKMEEGGRSTGTEE